MIDTDKYEGHTPAPWDGILSGYFTIEQLKGIDKTLMQDAPLLLEEVKRLQKYKRAFDRLYKMADADPDWKELTDDIWEMVE